MQYRNQSPPVTRRELLKWTLVAGAALGTRIAPAAGEMLQRRIPATGERVPAIGLGTSDAFETVPGQDLAPLRDVLQEFVARGGTLADTAAVYGNAEQVVGELSAELGIRDQLFLATKVTSRGREAGIAQMERSEQLLGRRPLDLIQVHNLVDVDTQLATLERWKQEGRVRYIGITHYRTAAFDDLERYMRSADLDFVQLNYSVTTPAAEQRLLPLAAERGIAVLVNRPFEDGRLFRATRGQSLPAWAAGFDCHSWAQFALKYVLAEPAVTCVIPATSKPAHLIDNMAAGRGRLPDATTRRRMRELAAAW